LRQWRAGGAAAGARWGARVFTSVARFDGARRRYPVVCVGHRDRLVEPWLRTRRSRSADRAADKGLGAAVSYGAGATGSLSGEWDAISLRADAITVTNLREGSEEKLRHMLESIVTESRASR